MEFYYSIAKKQKERKKRKRKKPTPFGSTKEKGKRLVRGEAPGICISCGYSNGEKMGMGKTIVCNM